MNIKLSKRIDTFVSIQKQLIDYIWENRNDFKKYMYFDYPTYCGIPRKLRKYFTSEFVDLLQEEVFDCTYDISCKHYIIKVEPSSKEELARIIFRYL